MLGEKPSVLAMPIMDEPEEPGRLPKYRSWLRLSGVTAPSTASLATDSGLMVPISCAPATDGASPAASAVAAAVAISARPARRMSGTWPGVVR